MCTMYTVPPKTKCGIELIYYMLKAPRILCVLDDETRPLKDFVVRSPVYWPSTWRSLPCRPFWGSDKNFVLDLMEPPPPHRCSNADPRDKDGVDFALHASDYQISFYSKTVACSVVWRAQVSRWVEDYMWIIFRMRKSTFWRLRKESSKTGSLAVVPWNQARSKRLKNYFLTMNGCFRVVKEAKIQKWSNLAWT